MYYQGYSLGISGRSWIPGGNPCRVPSLIREYRKCWIYMLLSPAVLFPSAQFQFPPLGSKVWIHWSLFETLGAGCVLEFLASKDIARHLQWGLGLLLLLSRFSHVWLCATPQTAAHQAPISGILQTTILEWVAIFFSSAWKWKVKVKSLSRVWLLATPWTAAYQAPASMGFSRQESWSWVPLPSPGVWGSTL